MEPEQLKKLRAETQRILKRKAVMRAVETDETSPILKPGEYPPCFKERIAYRKWLELEEEAPIPARKLFPMEPNYCHDCALHKEGELMTTKHELMAEGLCIHPELTHKRVRARYWGDGCEDEWEDVVVYSG